MAEEETSGLDQLILLVIGGALVLAGGLTLGITTLPGVFLIASAFGKGDEAAEAAEAAR